jgi:hypothetical protein
LGVYTSEGQLVESGDLLNLEDVALVEVNGYGWGKDYLVDSN